MFGPITLFLLFSLLATIGATWIAHAEKGPRVAAGVAVGSLLFFAALAAFVFWVVRQASA